MNSGMVTRLILQLFFTIASYGQSKLYVCPPCSTNCHDKSYQQPGTCPVCDMTLVQKTEKEYENYSKRTFFIKNGDIELNSAFYTPNNIKEKVGAVIIVHGSAPSTYEDFSYYTSIATKLGFAVLAFDKRGAGYSGGTYQPFNVSESIEWFNLLASDVLACLNWLKQQPEIDHQKIGLFGGSQAGWIMPLAASKDHSIKFIISGEGVSVSAGEEHYFSQLTGDGAENGISISAADKKLNFFDGYRGFDPRKILKNLNTKTLWFFGTQDPVIPVDASIRELKRIDNNNFEIIILPNGDHNFTNIETGERYNLVEYIKPWMKKLGYL